MGFRPPLPSLLSFTSCTQVPPRVSNIRHIITLSAERDFYRNLSIHFPCTIKFILHILPNAGLVPPVVKIFIRRKRIFTPPQQHFIARHKMHVQVIFSPFSFWDILILFFRSPNATSEEIELFCSFFSFLSIIPIPLK